MMSKNGIALVIMVLSFLGVTISEADAITTIGVLGQIASLIVMLYNQVTRKDVRGLIFKE